MIYRARFSMASRLAVDELINVLGRASKGGTTIPFSTFNYERDSLDLPTKMYICVLDSRGEIVADRNLDTDPEALLKFIAPFREDINRVRVSTLATEAGPDPLRWRRCHSGPRSSRSTHWRQRRRQKPGPWPDRKALCPRDGIPGS